VPRADSNGVGLWWEATGPADADVVVLVPGRGDSSDIWPPEFRDALVDAGFRVLVFDPRDTGASDAAEGYDLTAMADDVVAVLDAAGVERANVVGLSMGGFITVDLATRHRGRFGSLCFLSAMSPDPDAGFGPQFFAEGDPDPVESHLAAMGAPSDDDRAWVIARIDAARARTALRPDAVERHQAAAFCSAFPELAMLDEIDAPALVVHGGVDQVLPVAHGKALAAGIPGGRLVVLDDMGHLPTAAQWNVVADALVAHLADAATGSAARPTR
jgi:pimeloyl-ACP methyl ester carboxylesterase